MVNVYGSICPRSLNIIEMSVLVFLSSWNANIAYTHDCHKLFARHLTLMHLNITHTPDKPETDSLFTYCGGNCRRNKSEKWNSSSHLTLISLGKLLRRWLFKLHLPLHLATLNSCQPVWLLAGIKTWGDLGDLVYNNIIWLTLEHFLFLCLQLPKAVYAVCLQIWVNMSRTHSLLASSSLSLAVSLALRHHLSLVRRLLRCKVCYIIAQSVADAGVSPPLFLSILNAFSSHLRLTLS